MQPLNPANFHVEPSIASQLPSMVKSELSLMSASKQAEFLEEFHRRSASVGASYLCSLLFCHYAYLGRWGMTIIGWLVWLSTFGIVGFIWWVIDLFRIPNLVRDFNRDVAVSVLRDMKIIQARE